MEVAGAVTRRASLLPCFRADSSDRRKPCLAASVNVRNLGSKSGDPGLGNHRLTVTCGEKKEKRKLVKGLRKDLETFAAMGFGIDPRSGPAGKVHGSMMAEAAEVLLRQLQCLREAEEEAKMRRKQEKKHKSKAMQMVENVAVEPLTELGEGRCEKSTDVNSSCTDQVLSSTTAMGPVLSRSLDRVQKDHCGSCSLELLKASNISRQVQEVVTQPAATEVNAAHGAAQPVIPASPCQQESSRQLTLRPETGTKKVEVCMGGKCKNSGGSQLLELFQQLAENDDDDVSVVGCKCLGKCKNSPNVRLSTSNAAPAICSEVKMGDVDALMSSFYSWTQGLPLESGVNESL